jgi:RNA polymerase sigma-70 factor (ECF subfamily)
LTDYPEYIEDLKNGDRQAFTQLVDTYKNRVFNTILSVIQQQQDAEDLTQEVFIQVFNSISTFRGEAKLSSWIYKISIMKSYEFERKKKAQKRLNFFKNMVGLGTIQNEFSDFVHPGVELIKKEKAKHLFCALKKLPPNQRTVFTLIKIEGLSYQEVSEIMNKSVKSIEGLMIRAKKQLKIILKPYQNL